MESLSILKKGIYIFCLLTLYAFNVNGEEFSDSVAVAELDSLLGAQQTQVKELQSKADSVHIADSLEQVPLLANIANLKSTDQKKKAALQATLDSLQNVAELRKNKIQTQVDSLRKSTLGVPVVLYTDTLFFIYSKLGPYTPSDRVKGIERKIQMLVNDHVFEPEKLLVFEGEESHDLIYDDMILLSVTERDAFWLGMNRSKLTEQYSAVIKESVAKYQEETSLTNTLTRFGMVLLVLVMFILSIKYMNKGFTWLNRRLVNKGKLFFKDVNIKNHELFSAERIEYFVRWVLKMLKWIIILLIVYLSLPFVFSIFPTTKGVANTLFGFILTPLKKFGWQFINYIPALITIIVIVVITRYFVRFLKFISNEIAIGKLQLPGFYPDWASPTFNLLRIIIYTFSFIVIFPYLPGSESPVFQGVSVFLGLLISLGSSSAISNITAGLVITYMRAFKIGDRVKIGDITGDVIEKTMLVIRVRTIKNENVTIPNSAIMSGNTINYSTSAGELGLVLNTSVTIGYDVPWRTVHELLINAAQKTDFIKTEPQPFVLQTSLDDFYVSYQINAYTDQPGIAAKIFSQLHSNIQDEFNNAEIEIMSPHYRAERDGNAVTIPKK